MNAQEKQEISKELAETAEKEGEKIEFEQPLNFFASAGIGFRLGYTYDVTISSIDNTIQFQKLSSFTTGLSTGFIWNPFGRYKAKVNSSKVTKDEKGNYNLNPNEKASEGIDDVVYERKAFATALLINIFQLTLSSEQPTNSQFVDIGIGFGWRRDNFCILGAIDFNFIRQPRDYFLNAYKDKNLAITPLGSQEPLKSLDIKDDSFFYNKIIPALSFKIAYAFAKKK